VPILTEEKREQRKREIINTVTALAVNGVCPSKREIGNRIYQQILTHFGNMGEFCRAAGLTPCRPRKRWYMEKPEKREKREYKKGDLRKILGGYDVLDYAEGE
jgi:hypothetical protein